MSNVVSIDYFSKPGISASFLKSCSFSAWHGWKYLHEPFEPTAAMDFGSAVHCKLLEPQKFDSRFAVAQTKFDRRTKAGKEAAEAFEKEHAGKIVLTSDDGSRLSRIVESCLAIPIVKEALTTFEKEKELDLGDFKGKLDLVDLKNRVIIDVKTTRDATAREFVSQSLSLRYDIQLFHYAQLLGLGPMPTVYTIAIESDSAQVACYDVTDIVISKFTHNRYQKALQTAYEVLEMKACPPKFSTDIVNLTLPKWAIESESL